MRDLHTWQRNHRGRLLSPHRESPVLYMYLIDHMQVILIHIPPSSPLVSTAGCTSVPHARALSTMPTPESLSLPVMPETTRSNPAAGDVREAIGRENPAEAGAATPDAGPCGALDDVKKLAASEIKGK